MNSKEYFEDLIALDKRVKIMRKTLQKLRESLDVKGINYESIGAKAGSKCSDKMAEAIEKMIDYEKQLKEEEARLALLRMEAEILISSLTEEKEREVLVRMYIWLQPVNDICREMNYSKRSVYDYRKNGLEKIRIPIQINDFKIVFTVLHSFALFRTLLQKVRIDFHRASVL